IADELLARLRSIDNVGKSWVVGASPRQISVYPDPARLKASQLSVLELQQALLQNNLNLPIGKLTQNNQEISLEAGPYYQSAADVAATVIKTHNGRLLRLGEVAQILDGPADTDYYTHIGFGPAVEQMHRLGETAALPAVGEQRELVTVAVAKRRGSNAVSVAEQVMHMSETLQGSLIPSDVLVSVTRNYGETADHKVNELVMHLSIAILTIIVLLALTLGFKESLIVSLAVPMTFAITLLCDLIFGYTINRVTLFALILSLGLLVDDPIVDVENIHRHYQMRKQPPLQRGYQFYQRIMQPLLNNKRKAQLFLLAVVVAFVASAMMAVTRVVPLKLLPFDNKNELQLMIDMPRGSSLENTQQVAQALGEYLSTVNEVSSYQSYVGTSSPMDFNGMVRHYYLRQGSYLGDIRIVLADKARRKHQSHDIALRIRPDIDRIEAQYGANIKIVEMPPGPPVLSTLVAEVYGPDHAGYDDLIQVAKRVKTDIEHTEGVVDVDDFVEAEQGQLHFIIDQDRAAQLGLNNVMVAETLSLAIKGTNAGLVHIDQERQPLTIHLQFPRASRSTEADLLAL
ncbi:MAG: efflux RND transporter permease subunit, partial [Methylococcaceae bacterium]|nr:efflux RND transporter permease subunit [Methylococcaceae bacterium]